MCISSESHRFVQGKNDTKPIHSLQFQAIATRPPIGTDIHRPVIINVKRFLRMFAERLTSAAIFFLHPTPDTLASSLRADTFHALCQNAGFAGY